MSPWGQSVIDHNNTISEINSQQRYYTQFFTLSQGEFLKKAIKINKSDKKNKKSG
jgi:hypothetical protein